jgi:chloramphenicol 3-O-phosphotransferase
MDLIFLHGAPAVGKLTTAKAILEMCPGRLFDNHVAIDCARSMFDFGAPGFNQFVGAIRIAGLTAAAKQQVEFVVMTYCYADPEDLPEFELFERIWQSKGGRLLPVFLQCSVEEAERRVSNEDRIARRKTASREGLARLTGAYNLTFVPRSACLKLDTSDTPAPETAKAILRHFKLGAFA